MSTSNKKKDESKRIQDIKKQIEKSQEMMQETKQTSKGKKGTSKNNNSKKEVVQEVKEEPKVEKKAKNEKNSENTQVIKEPKKEAKPKNKKKIQEIEESKNETKTEENNHKKKSSKTAQEKENPKEKIEIEKISKSKKPKEVEEKVENNAEKEKEEPKENALVPTFDKQEGKPEYVKEMLKAKRKKTVIFVCIVMLIILIIGFSTIFAILNLDSIKITKGVSIRGVDVSDLTIEEASEKVAQSFDNVLIPELKLKYDEYTTSLTAEQIGFKFNVEEAVKEAYDIGRSENILINNYILLYTTFKGKEIDISYTVNQEQLDNFIDDVSSKIPGLVIDPGYYIEDDKLIIESGKDGIEVKKEELKEEILINFSNRTLDEVSEENYIQTIEIPTQNAKARGIDMDKVYSEIYREPQDAYFELEPYKIYPDIDGIDLQMSLEEAKKQITGEQDEYQFDLKITKASKTIKDLGAEAFPYQISEFSTRYDASNTNRSTNLRIAAEKINGIVLMPGEIFSYNKTVGKRTVEEGYKDAKIYADGGVVDGLAGGICQISSTLYNAVLLANLEIVERKNHSFTTSYVAAGRDATVVWGTIDFQFKNSRNYPIKIEASVKNGVAEFKIHGMQEQEEYEISILPRTTASIPYPTAYVDDPTLAPGQQVTSQAGHLGYKVTTYKVKTLNGVEVSREVLSNDTYQPMKAIVRRGPIVAPAM